MKQKRKYHEISDDESDITVNMDNAKRIKISQSSFFDQIDPKEDEVWLIRLPGHLNPDQLYDKKVKLRKLHLEIAHMPLKTLHSDNL